MLHTRVATPKVVIAGLVPAIPIREAWRMSQYYVYILASRPGGAIYVGVTNDLMRRVCEHKNGLVSGFTSDTGSTVSSILRCTTRRIMPSNERRISSTGTRVENRLIAQSNPAWRDLYEEIV
jgi:putative endonuclease